MGDHVQVVLSAPCGPEPPTLTGHPLAHRYATVYTMFPVFSLVLDQDVKPEVAMLYPELYKDLTKVWPGRGWGRVGGRPPRRGAGVNPASARGRSHPPGAF